MFTCFVFGGNISFAASKNLAVEGVRFGQAGERTRIVLDLSAPMDYRVFLLENPRRIAVDLPPLLWRAAQSRALDSDLLRSYRSGVLQDGLVRIVFDLRRPAVVAHAFLLPKDGSGKDRLVLDIQPSSANIFAARVYEILGNAKLKPEAAPPPPKVAASAYRALQNKKIEKESSPPPPAPKPDALKAKPERYTIVLDPGHGGADPGAISGKNIYEKKITLNIARELKRQLEETGKFRVVLTRDKDVYIRLRGRVEMARKAKADLFISLHADKIHRSSVRGASIYTLSKDASDEETARLAETENNAGFVAGVDLGQESAEVADILLDLAMREKMNESDLLARMLEQALRRKNIRLLPNSHRSAGFAVLKAPDVPAALIEAGFLSNVEEAKLLNSNEFQRNFSAAVVEGVSSYFRKIEALQKF